MELINDISMQKVKGGSITATAGIIAGISIGISFVIGIIDGFLNPNECNIESSGSNE